MHKSDATEKEIVQALRNAGCMVVLVASRGDREKGVPDAFVSHPKTLTVAMEFKTKKGRQSKEQETWARAWVAFGGIYVIARTPTEALASIGLVAS